jgi:lipopolysaccharide transport system permease protein
LTPAIEQAREVLFWGNSPDLNVLSTYLLGTGVVAWLGFAWFQKTRRGFADVL